MCIYDAYPGGHDFGHDHLEIFFSKSLTGPKFPGQSHAIAAEDTWIEKIPAIVAVLFVIETFVGTKKQTNCWFFDRQKFLKKRRKLDQLIILPVRSRHLLWTLLVHRHLRMYQLANEASLGERTKLTRLETTQKAGPVGNVWQKDKRKHVKSMPGKKRDGKNSLKYQMFAKIFKRMFKNGFVKSWDGILSCFGPKMSCPKSSGSPPVTVPSEVANLPVWLGQVQDLHGSQNAWDWFYHIYIYIYIK